MSTHTIEWLNQNVLVDETRHGKAWHFDPLKQGDEPNHYQGPIPVADVERRLFPWEPMGLDIRMVVPDGTEIPKDVVERLVDQGFVIPDYKVWVRSDNFEVMGLHGENYVGHSYRRWLLENVSSIIDDELTIASAGVLNDGAQAWVEISIPESVLGPDGIAFRPLLLATTSLDGTIATTYKRTVILAVCDNTRAAALSGTGEEFKVKHTKNSELRLMDSREALGIVHTMADDYKAELEKLLAQKVTAKQWNKFLDAPGIITKEGGIPKEDFARRDNGEVVVLNKKQITMAERRRDALIYTYNHDERVAPWKGTAFGVVQAINTHDHHESRVNQGTIRLERNMERAAKGYYDKLDRDAYRTLQTVLK